MGMQGNPHGGMEHEVKERAEAVHSHENLALLYQGLLTGIVRLQSQRQHISDGESFRRRTKATLQEVEQVAVAAGYDPRDVKDTHYAVVAFLDSVVLHSKHPVRTEWERRTLQEELFGKSDAGIVFFEKLEHFRSRRDSEQLADIVEVYLLCMLLGFEGRYSGGPRGELDGIIQRTRLRIQDIRGRHRQISPTALPSETPLLAMPVQNRTYPFRIAALVAVIASLLCWIAGTVTLNSEVSRTSEQLHQSLRVNQVP
jgi:type VI secretion system protein ImpK